MEVAARGDFAFVFPALPSLPSNLVGLVGGSDRNVLITFALSSCVRLGR